MPTKRVNKQASRKKLIDRVWSGPNWVVNYGRLVPPPGRPHKTRSLFQHVAEKLPYESLPAVEKMFREYEWDSHGVYIAHDSMGFARYVGRGQVFARLRARKYAQQMELFYFSFYIVASNKHEREIETLMIRLGGPHLHFNSKKKRIDTSAGNIVDYEPGTDFMERQYKRGRVRSINPFADLPAD